MTGLEHVEGCSNAVKVVTSESADDGGGYGKCAVRDSVLKACLLFLYLNGWLLVSGGGISGNTLSC